ncbi:MAG: nucleotidyltransferase domain-containing protein [Candidatus Geothermincolia bacterium]
MGGSTGRQLAGLVGYSHTHTMAALDDLELQGLVTRRYAGNAHVFSINEENAVVTDILIPAFLFESNLLDALADMFYQGLGQKLVSVTLFGSVARGEESPDSDVDLLLVMKDEAHKEKAELKALAIGSVASRRFGAPISPIVVTQSEYDSKVKRKRGFWKEIPTEGRRLLRHEERESF